VILEDRIGEDLLEGGHNMRVRDRPVVIGLAGDARQVGDGPCLDTEMDVLRGASDALQSQQEHLCHFRPAGHGRGVKLCHFLRFLRFHALFIEYSEKDVKHKNFGGFSMGYRPKKCQDEILYEKTPHHKMQG